MDLRNQKDCSSREGAWPMCTLEQTADLRTRVQPTSASASMHKIKNLYTAFLPRLANSVMLRVWTMNRFCFWHMPIVYYNILESNAV